MKALKASPDPRIRAALSRQYWSTSEQIVTATGLAQAVVSARLRKMWKDGELDRMQDRGKLVYRHTNLTRKG